MQEVEGGFAARLGSLDVSLFDGIATQSSHGDRRAWLAVQRAIRQPSGYTYLEIGSHLGGSIQQHLVDPLCQGIVSIDKRPLDQPDNRGSVYAYEGNSTERMLENLRRISPEDLGKITCFDADARDIKADDVPTPPDFCFIDGEHTLPAVLSDFAFCLKVCAPNAAICFHDDNVIYRALEAILSDLRRQGIPFTPLKLSGATFGIFLRDCPALRDPYLASDSQGTASWFRRQRVRRWVPNWLKPSARGVARWLGISRSDA